MPYAPYDGLPLLLWAVMDEESSARRRDIPIAALESTIVQFYVA